MRYYVEINGESSLDIQGLMIQSLPSISKPLMRSKQETIDGRDGDIVTKLGYSAYDKTLKIGLWGNYDINEVISFFNQEGTITFSNEPDKYYRFTILNRDDYVSQLDKFRTCTIALHCQPYKYKLNEETEELENEYVEQEGTSLSFNNSLVAPMNIDLKGNTLQNGTPTPSSPIPINNVSGDNDIVVCGSNIFIPTLTNNGADIQHANCNVSLTNDEFSLTSTGSNIRIGEVINTNENYTNSAGVLYNVNGNSKVYVKCTNTDFNGIFITSYDSDKKSLGFTQLTSEEYTLPTNAVYFSVRFGINGSTTGTTYKTKVMVSFIPITTYEAYNGTTYNIDLPVENLFDIKNTPIAQNNLSEAGITLTFNDNGTITANGTNTASYKFIKYNITLPAGTYYVSGCISGGTINGYTSIVQPNNIVDYGNGATFTLTQTATIEFYPIRIGSNTITFNNAVFKPMITKIKAGYEAYTPYGTTPIELNKIGTYQDYIYKENDKWYLHKETGKYTFTGDETFTLQNSNKRAHILNTNNQLGDILKTTGGTGILYGMYSNKLEEKTANQTWTGTQGISYDYNSGSNQEDIDISINGLTTIDQYKSAINGITMCFILNTPTNTEITYTPLINQLESIKNAMSKEGTTNVNQVNNDAPFIITASVLSGTDSITLTNEGNATSKPTITITGSGVVGVYLENIQMFNISLGTNETIIIDTENMEAYYGSQLKNRQVTGDYSNFALQSGTNNLKFTGLVTNVEITNYNRWI